MQSHQTAILFFTSAFRSSVECPLGSVLNKLFKLDLRISGLHNTTRSQTDFSQETLQSVDFRSFNTLLRPSKYLEFTQNQSINLQSNMASCADLMWSFFWLIVLFFIGWPLSIFFGGIYGFLSPLTTCVGLDQVTDVLLQGANLGRTCAENMRSSKALC
ncbi:hypothetical protein chiPu_0006564 [Chiloscyllium punctatum]|uniref:Uncharacterized protein n=1 Tax=Chiloscyllium punctatum TaxID=137246 RepID=A0A401SCJ2_CHIPU|nr:hypothetical protein [Chiloscyllium punctatum]